MNRLQCQAFYEQLENLFYTYSRLAFLTADNETLFLKYQALSDIGTLPQSAEVSNKYLHIQDGDIVLTNDPYSGGTLLSSPTLILGVGMRNVKGQTPAEYLVASRLTMSTRGGPFKNIDEEGLRIPPSPLYLKGEVNEPIVAALNSHPQTPPQFMKILEDEAKNLLQLRLRIKTELANGTLDLSKNKIRSYLQATENEFSRRLDEIGQGNSFYEYDISDKETIKLKTEHHDSHFSFDFSGTSPGHTIFLTDSTTIGAAIGATLSLLRDNVPINSGVFSCFDVKAPRGSLVNAAFPSPVYVGHTEGLNLVATAVTKGLAKIDKRKSVATSGPSHARYEFVFPDGSFFTDLLPIGGGAAAQTPGLNGIHMWNRLMPPGSIEMLERQYPMQIVNTGFRASSGGDGQYLGGHGVVRTIKLLVDAELRWAHIAPPHKPEGAEGGKAALGPELILQLPDGTKEDLTTSGVRKILRGSTLTVMSAGGGGYGAKAT
jgi:N-methylhydantoinase B